MSDEFEGLGYNDIERLQDITRIILLINMNGVIADDDCKTMTESIKRVIEKLTTPDPRIKEAIDCVDELRLFYCGGGVNEFTGGKVFAAKEILAKIKAIAESE